MHLECTLKNVLDRFSTSDHFGADPELEHIQMPLKHGKTWGSNHLPRKPVLVSNYPLVIEVFPDIYSELLLTQCWAIPTSYHQIPGRKVEHDCWISYHWWLPNAPVYLYPSAKTFIPPKSTAPPKINKIAEHAFSSCIQEFNPALHPTFTAKLTKK